MTANRHREQLHTDSQRYGNDKTIDEVFDQEHQPTHQELEEALAETDYLTEKEAFAFVHGHFGQLPLPKQVEKTSEALQNQGFEGASEFNAAKQRAKKKIGDATWIIELIDAFRMPDFPQECTECGRSLGGTWVEPEDGSGFLCRDCADVEQFPRPWSSDTPHQ